MLYLCLPYKPWQVYKASRETKKKKKSIQKTSLLSSEVCLLLDGKWNHNHHLAQLHRLKNQQKNLDSGMLTKTHSSVSDGQCLHRTVLIFRGNAAGFSLKALQTPLLNVIALQTQLSSYKYFICYTQLKLSRSSLQPQRVKSNLIILTMDLR